MNNLYILGASNPEMEHIEMLLKNKEERIAFAAVKDADGKLQRVKPFEAYKKDLVAMNGDGKEMNIFVCPYHGRVVTVECALPIIIDDGECRGCGYCECAEWGQPQVTHMVIDRHNPCDPGFGKEPKDYLMELPWVS